MKQKETKRARVGLYSAGLHAYWAQFAGLHDRILGYNAFIESRVSQWGEVFNFGLVDSEVAARDAGLRPSRWMVLNSPAVSKLKKANCAAWSAKGCCAPPQN